MANISLPDCSAPLSFELRYRPPYDWPELLQFLASRAISGVEMVQSNAYYRTVRIAKDGQERSGWIEVTPAKRHPSLCVFASASLADSLPGLSARIEHLLDLSCDPAPINIVLGSLASSSPGRRVPGAFDGFEVAVRAILGQQVSVASARTLAGRFAAAFGGSLATPFAGINRIFPSAATVAVLQTADVARLGVIGSRAQTIIALAQALRDDQLRLTPGTNVELTMTQLRALRGIGVWTAQYVAMRALAWRDAFPHTDLGVMKALGESNPKRVLERAEAWRPWRAYAVMHLWASLKTGAATRIADSA